MSSQQTKTTPKSAQLTSPNGAMQMPPEYTFPQSGQNSEVKMLSDVGDYLMNYARERPDVAALWCFGIGFVLGWKLKPW